MSLCNISELFLFPQICTITRFSTLIFYTTVFFCLKSSNKTLRDAPLFAVENSNSVIWKFVFFNAIFIRIRMLYSTAFESPLLLINNTLYYLQEITFFKKIMPVSLRNYLLYHFTNMVLVLLCQFSKEINFSCLYLFFTPLPFEEFRSLVFPSILEI